MAAQSLYDLLIGATVRLVASNGRSEGTGFFVAPQRVLTCAHVVLDADGKPQALTALFAGVEYPVLACEFPGSDLCLLHLPEFEHPCVGLGDEAEPRDPLFWFGFPGTGSRNALRGESSTAASEGIVVEGVDAVDGARSRFLKFAPGAVKPGMSGAPLLDERTGCVCGVIKRTRNSDIDQGGLAVPVSLLRTLLPGLWVECERAHSPGSAWEAARRRSAGALWRAVESGPPSITEKVLTRTFVSLIEGRTADFVGRRFVFDALDRILGSPDRTSGYVLITGEPGLGKTALMARLVKTRGYVHHFNVASLDIRSPRQFVENVCGQLIVKYQLAPTPAPAALAECGAYFADVLAQASAARAGEPVVLLVDAIDEAVDDGLPPGANRLCLPRDLPAGVFVVLTSRPQAGYRLVVEALTPIALREDDDDNRRDVDEYIGAFIARHESAMVAIIQGWGVTEEEFQATLRERSEGNFMYLRHVLPDIRDGRLDRNSIADVYSLPLGISEYYRWHWSQTRDRDPSTFDSLTRPVICAFAAAKEPVSVSQVVRWTRSRWPGLEPGAILGVVADWRQFLDEERPPGQPPRYRIYHATFREFLDKVEGLGLYEDMIIDSALATIPGFRAPPSKENADAGPAA